MNQLLFAFTIILFISFFTTCEKDSEGKLNINKDKISGYVQKGPYINGTSILMSELNSSLEQTGKIFSTQITNNSGNFEIDNIALSSRFVEFYANGYYFNEIDGTNSNSPLSLYALSDISDISTVNINILTHLERQRVKYLIKHGKSFSESKKIAQGEILSIFGFGNHNIDNSETLDISINNEDNAILLTISTLLQSESSSVGNLTELMANISNDLKEDGVLNDSSIVTSLRNSAKTINKESIRAHLEDRYESMDISATIPGFEKYIDSFLIFTAKSPSIGNTNVTNITINGATLNSYINPNSLSTLVTFKYGMTNEYSESIYAEQSPINGNSEIPVSVSIKGLLPGTTYYFKVKSENEKGTAYSEDFTFTTLGNKPIIISTDVSNINATSVTFLGIVNPNDLTTIISFEYGESEEYGKNIYALQSPLIGNIDTQISSDITGLLPITLYHFRIKAENELGICWGEDMTFTTKAFIKDIDGNIYSEVLIEDKWWMKENLRTTRYNNGDVIGTTTPETLDISGTSNAKYQWAYKGDENYVWIYGRLYTASAANDERKICPVGWHIPSEGEWRTLEEENGALIEPGTFNWKDPNYDGDTNETNFSAVPGGFRNPSGEFLSMGDSACFWSNKMYYDPAYKTIALPFVISENPIYSLSHIFFHISGNYGFSVRCVKDY